jgi:hypothetical protein
LSSIPTLEDTHASRGVAQDRSQAAEEQSPQDRRAAARARKTFVPQTQIEEATEGKQKEDKPVESNSSLSKIINNDTSDSDPESTEHEKSSSAKKQAKRKQIQSDKDLSGRHDTSDSDADSTKHQKSSSIHKPAERQQITSNRNDSGHDETRHKNKTKLFKTTRKKQNNGPKFEDQYCLVNEVGEGREKG